MSHNMCNMHKDVKRLIYNEETEQSYQKAIEQCCTKQFSTTIRSRLSLSLSSNLLPTLASVYRHWRCSSSATTASAPTFTYSREQRTDFSRLSSLMNMARLAAANDEDRPPRLENEVIKVINVWVSSQKRIQRMEWGTEKSKQNSPEKNLESILLFCLHSSKLCAASAAGENHWRAKRWTFWLITRPAPNANFQIITGAASFIQNSRQTTVYLMAKWWTMLTTRTTNEKGEKYERINS